MNKMGSEGVAHLAESFEAGACPELSVLTCGSNMIGSAGLLRLVQALKSGAVPNLVSLDLTANKITDR